MKATVVEAGGEVLVLLQPETPEERAMLKASARHIMGKTGPASIYAEVEDSIFGITDNRNGMVTQGPDDQYPTFEVRIFREWPHGETNIVRDLQEGDKFIP